MTDRKIQHPAMHADLQRSREPGGWYAVHVRAKFEKTVARGIREKGYEEFLPVHCTSRQWSDRTARVEQPLFPGYVFCRAEPTQRPPLVTTPGIIRIVSFGDQLAVIPDRDIDAIRRAVASSPFAKPWPFLSHGQRARIRSGALTGIEGIVVRVNGRCRLVLSVEALCRSIAIEIQADNAEPIDLPIPTGEAVTADQHAGYNSGSKDRSYSGHSREHLFTSCVDTSRGSAR
jgi:transcription antitermination factor NusG